jgi:acetyltransferase-like isoleucine patch superfamily enzyme
VREIGEFTYGHESIEVLTWGEDAKLVIGKFCSIAPRVRIFLGGNHNANWISTYPFGHINQGTFGEDKLPGHPSTNGDVNIGNDVWIGYGSTLMSGVSVGSGAVIAANSHVVKDIPSYEIWGGNPARFIRRRFTPDIVTKLVEISWWDYPVEKVLLIRNLLNSELTQLSVNELERVLKS